MLTWLAKGAWGATKALPKIAGSALNKNTLSGAFGSLGLTTPLIFAGGFGAMSAGLGLMNSGFQMDSPRTAWGYTPGMESPYTQGPMSFRSIPNVNNMESTGSMAFAMHNMRKG